MRLIDADALQNILLTIATALEHEYGSLGGAISGCMKHIDNAPTVDAVPVVRCQECKRWESCCNGKAGLCQKRKGVARANDFCSYGERKEGADHG